MRNLIVLIVLTVFAVGAFAQDPYHDPQLDPSFPPLADNIELLQLENGLEVILMRNPAQPMVGIYTQVKVGSAREDYRTSGMSHMLEHLLFNGSEKYTQEELYDAADLAGAYNNANTADFYTNYMMVLPAAELETGLARFKAFAEAVPGADFSGLIVERVVVEGSDVLAVEFGEEGPGARHVAEAYGEISSLMARHGIGVAGAPLPACVTPDQQDCVAADAIRLGSAARGDQHVGAAWITPSSTRRPVRVRWADRLPSRLTGPLAQSWAAAPLTITCQ
mgnify:CR=1 FL=1